MAKTTPQSIPLYLNDRDRNRLEQLAIQAKSNLNAVVKKLINRESQVNEVGCDRFYINSFDLEGEKIPVRQCGQIVGGCYTNDQGLVLVIELDDRSTICIDAKQVEKFAHQTVVG